MNALRTRLADFAAIARLRRSGVPFPDVAPTGGAEQRVLIAPTNSAGQGYRWARALESAVPGVAVTSMAFIREQNPFAYPIDQAVPSGYAAHSSKWQQAQEAAVSSYSAALIESAQPPFSRLRGQGTIEQVAELRRAGVRCALLFHGSDIRDPEAHAQREPHSPFRIDPSFRARMQEVTACSRRIVQATQLPVFVSTPDLLREVEGAKWLPVVIDVAQWENPRVPLQHGGPPRVVHVPSNAMIKGTDLIDEQLKQLHAAGVIKFRPVSGVAHHEMPEVYRNADIVIDQFRIGNYGVAACEAMAAGRIVVSHVSDEVRETTKQLTGSELPITQARAEHLTEVLTRIADQPADALRTAARGPDFVREWHDGAYSGRVLRAWLEEDK